MNWFERLCRNVGLMVHGMKRPDEPERKILKKEVEEEKRDGMILRRTTIEEIEIRKDDETHS